MLDQIFIAKRNSVTPIAMPVEPQTRTKDPTENEKNIFSTLKLFVLFSQALGILPQESVNKGLNAMHFKWFSWRTLYSLIAIISSSVAVICSALYCVMYGSSIKSTATGVFYGGSLATTTIYLYLAISWAKLMKFWCSVDEIMNIHYGYPVNLDRKIKFFCILFLALCIVDFALNVANRCEQVSNMYGKNAFSLIYFNDSFPEFFTYVPYSTGAAIFTTILTFYSYFTWSLHDLFIIIVSIPLAMRFRQITQKLKRYNENQKNVSLLLWKQIREDYSRLTNLCKEVDSYISPVILLSYSVNMFFLLLHLYYSLEFIALEFQKGYFAFSFASLVFKIIAVSLYAAWVNEESKSPTNILNFVDSSLYNVEIRRILTEISFDKTSLTGYKMFSIKREIILSMAGAAVTYELILIQFSASKLYGDVW